MKLIKNPWYKLFYSLISSSKKSIKITSPFIKYAIVDHLLNSKLSNKRLSIITSFKLMNFYLKESDLTALEMILKKKGEVKNFQKLHSKIYIFDEKSAIITSSNLTNGGLIKNFEYGIFIEEGNLVNRIVKDFEELYTNEITGNITLQEILKAKEIISKVPSTKPIVLPEIETKREIEITDIYTGGVDSIKSSLSGWKLEVFNCLLDIPKDFFTLGELNKFVPRLKKIFPHNYNIEAKIRQQLQNLRDIGLVQFLGKGNYQKLWK